MRLVSKGKGELPTVMNFGCGNTLDPCASNIDIKVSNSVLRYANENDIWLFQGNLSDPHEFSANYFDEIHCIDVLEHIHPDLIGNILYCFRCCLRQGGLLQIQVPDFDNMAKDIVAASKNTFVLSTLELLRKIEINWMAPYLHDNVGHMSIWTRHLAEYRIQREGFKVIGIKTTNEYSMMIEAVKI